jgi:hypothetical protein
MRSWERHSQPQKNYRNLLLGYFEEKETLMRNMKMALVVLAVLAVASTSFAGPMMTATKIGTPAAGLEAWLISSTGTNALQDIMVDGAVHQSSVKSGFSYPATVYLENFGEGTPEDVIATDTHFLFGAVDVLIGSGAGSETNAGGNPYTLPTYDGAVKYGMGTFSGGMAFAIKPELNPLAGFDIMQVVIAAGSMVPITAMAADPSVTGSPIGQVGCVAGVPEPGTIALLIAGALCLVVARFRK